MKVYKCKLCGFLTLEEDKCSIHVATTHLINELKTVARRYIDVLEG